MLINVPLMLGIFVTARPLVHVVYGEKWLPCVPFLQILSLSGILWPLHVINLNLVKSRGRSDLFFRLEVIKKSLGVTCLLIAAQISLIAMAWSQLIVAIACYFINAWHSRRLADYPINDQLRDASPYLAVGAVMVAAASLPRLFPAISPALLLVTQTLLGAAVYISLCHLLRLAALKDGALRLRRMLARRGAAVAHA
jgi:teichuronic acid exporter